MTIFGMTRCKNEGRWIKMVLESYMPLCERIWVFDDGSTDGTAEIAESMGEQITVIRSPFRAAGEGLDETRDKDFLLQRLNGCVSDVILRGNEQSPFWALCFDGDELLDHMSGSVIRANLKATAGHAFSLPIRFLWDSDLSLIKYRGHRRVRVDRVYSRFATVGRPSIFRLFNAAFKFQRTPWGGNFHCSSIPQELLHCAHTSLPAPVYHLGYTYREDRIRKFKWYNSIDPNNTVEDRYIHMVQGDGPIDGANGFPDGFAVPSDAVLRHAGPIVLEMM